MTVLSWYENLPKDEIPPKHLWFDSKGLSEHFDLIDRKWKSGEHEEAPEGTLQDARDGRNVTLRNRYAQSIMDARRIAASDDLWDL